MAIEAGNKGTAVTLSNGLLTVAVDPERGTASFEWRAGAQGGTVELEGAGEQGKAGARYVRHLGGRVRLGEDVRATSAADRRACETRDVEDGAELRATYGFADGLTLTHVFRLFEELPYAFVRLEAQRADGAELASNEIAPLWGEDGADGLLGLDADETDEGKALRALLVPFDNDKWVRYEAAAMPGAIESCEATAIYWPGSRHGIVIGSVSHDTWKTGIRVHGRELAGGRVGIARLEAFGGLTSELTRDTVPHGAVRGAKLVSPTLFVGAFDDYRTGLETFADANAKAEPPLAWDGSVPFGWNSWSAVGGELTFDSYRAASDLIRDVYEGGFHDRGVAYVNFDSFWTNLTDEERLGAVAHANRNGQKAGTYWTPFAYWGKPEEAGGRIVEGTDGQYTYADLLLRDREGNVLPDLDGGYAIDPTHPGNLLRTEHMLRQFVGEGFEYAKLDFVAHGALEGAHHLPSVQTGVQAYRYGMAHIVSLLDPARIGRPFFIHLSIAPLFPHPYAHGRRVSCDAFGELKDTEYMLNSVTYGWWIHNRLYRFNDPDHTVLYKSFNHEPTTEAEGRSRLNASLIAGTLLLMGDDYRLEEARRRALAWLSRPELTAIAKKGDTFVPLEGDTGDRSTDVFYRLDRACGEAGADVLYAAVFNFDKERPARREVELARCGIDASQVERVEELWTGRRAEPSPTLAVDLAPADSAMFKLTLQDAAKTL